MSPLRTYFGHMKENVTGNSQCGYSKDKSCSINLILFYDKMMGLVDEGRGMEAIYLDCSKAFSAFTECLKFDIQLL